MKALHMVLLYICIWISFCVPSIHTNYTSDESLGVEEEKSLKTVMKSILLCNKTIHFIPFSKTFENKFPICSSPSTFIVNCKQNEGEVDNFLSASSPYELLGIDPSCSFADIKAAYRSKVKQYHPDVYKDVGNSDSMIRRVIQAYETLSKNHQFNNTAEMEGLDPFDDPECEAFDVFVNETLCVGRGCSSSCVKKAPHAFSFVSATGTARVISQGRGDDYLVQTAVNQCPRSCIHYVTPSQRIILEELLNNILDSPWNSSAAEADILYSLIVKAKFENNRYQKPKKQHN